MEEKNIKADLAIIAVCAVLFGLSFVPALSPFGIWLCLAAAVVAARETLKEGIEGILKLRFDEAALMSIAVAAAFLIGEYHEGAMVALLFSLGEELEDLAVDRSRENIAALADIRPDTANLVTGDETETVPAETVAVGSKILVKVGERVPLDCEVLSESAIADASALTGESIPVTVKAGEVLKAGSVILASPVLAETVSGYGDSAAARIIDMVENAGEKKGVTEKFITKFSSIYTPVVIALAGAVFFGTWLIGRLELAESAHRALVFLVSSCPCALVISVPLAYFAGIGSASRAGVIIKGSEYCERLAKVKNAVFDKTGTLTSGELRVAEIKTFGGAEENTVLKYAAMAEALSDHPVARCLAKEAKLRGIFETASEKVNEIAGEGVTVSVGGKKVACGNRKLFEHLK